MLVPPLAAILTVGVTIAFTLIVTLFEVTTTGEAQVAFDVSSQVITSLFASEVDV